MSLKEKLLNSTSFTRRTFLKGASVAGATAALYGCGGGGGGKTYMEEDTTVEVPKITERIVAGATPHNCGGRCQSRYYVKDGVIKRIVTDEKPDLPIGAGDDPQYRSCVRCRSRKEWFYRKDRLMYPLKQTGNRGDVSTLVRISWDQAFTEIAAKMADLKTRFGAKAFHSIYSSGDASGWARNSLNRLLSLYGGYTSYYTNYSFPALEHVAKFVDGATEGTPAGNGRQDAVNAERIVLWSYNPHETVFGTNTAWYLQQAKEKGIPVIAVDTRVSKAVATAADEFINLMPATDSALILGMMYHLLTARFADLDVASIDKYCFGFFDNGSTILRADVDATKYTVPAGASLSAFVLGNETSLVTAGRNNATSVYPNTIGYNVNATDPLFGKTVKIWGQTPKTPEWAEKITGVPAAKIRELANMYLDHKVTTWIGGGYQRHTESEQAVWLNRIFSVITDNWGQFGASSGRNSNNVTATLPSDSMSAGLTNGVNLESAIYAANRMTSPLSYVHAVQRANIPVFIVADAVDNMGTPNSKWNDGQVKHLPEGFGKAIFAAGGNIMANQSGDINYNLNIFKNKSKAELIVTFDHFLTPSAAISDYILPSTMQGEKPGSANAWGTGEACIRLSKVHDIPGEVMDEYSICAGIAEKLGLETSYLAGYPKGQEGMEARIKKGWETGNLSTKYGMSYDEWVEKGIASLHKTYTPSQYFIKFKAFRDNPTANPLLTPSGKFEAYSMNMMEDYEARYHENIDTSTTDAGGVATLYNAGTIYSRYHGANTGRRFVYPIPMYIPTIEGRHAIDTVNPTDAMAHDDPLGCNAKGYTYTLHTWHLMYRSHSTLANVAYLNENFKKDIHGNPTYLNPNRNFRDGVWDDNVYEPIWLNPSDAADLGLAEGDRALIENDRGKMYVSVVLTQRVPKKIIYIGQGAWEKKNAQGIDIGGSANSVITARPSRICKGMTSANDCRVKITKA